MLKKRRPFVNVGQRIHHSGSAILLRNSDAELRIPNFVHEKQRRHVSREDHRYVYVSAKRRANVVNETRLPTMLVNATDAERANQFAQPDARFKRDFEDHSFGHRRNVCDRLHFDNNITLVGSIKNKAKQSDALRILLNTFVNVDLKCGGVDNNVNSGNDDDGDLNVDIRKDNWLVYFMCTVHGLYCVSNNNFDHGDQPTNIHGSCIDLVFTSYAIARTLPKDPLDSAL
ncbi:hypothetical protein HPB51_022013 [Rhipicephalus microplus]|uniref:Uncharacterized protein n=1 Tax=Rhipicephalus microplus TaxID=6941 RepID=A0A9J6DJI8_RHIMP|nr:hypothetical protein HPB51_022013 [Rhipicephalus microplus]